MIRVRVRVSVGLEVRVRVTLRVEARVRIGLRLGFRVKSSGISPAHCCSHLFYTSHVFSQGQTRVKLNRVFFPR